MINFLTRRNSLFNLSYIIHFFCKSYRTEDSMKENYDLSLVINFSSTGIDLHQEMNAWWKCIYIWQCNLIQMRRINKVMKQWKKMDENAKYYIKWCNPVSERQFMYVLFHMWILDTTFYICVLKWEWVRAGVRKLEMLVS